MTTGRGSNGVPERFKVAQLDLAMVTQQSREVLEGIDVVRHGRVNERHVDMDEQLRLAWPIVLQGIARGIHAAHDEIFACWPMDYYGSAYLPDRTDHGHRVQGPRGPGRHLSSPDAARSASLP
ncbi:MAG: hypothetical protein MUF54_23815 [Polyangiaceae bacterium]|jgi:hypothetical protein|nr:hypothetical protein [Polyangiaceae bacterium]